MRMIMTALAGAAVLAIAPMPAFAHHKTGHNVPTAAQVEAAQRERDPCAVGSNNPHEPASLRALTERCRQLRAQLQANPNDAALRERCDHAARALTGAPC